MSHAATLSHPPYRPGPLRRAWRRFWLARRVRWAQQDISAMTEQIARDMAQMEAHRYAIAVWRAEIAYHQEPQEGS